MTGRFTAPVIFFSIVLVVGVLVSFRGKTPAPSAPQLNSYAVTADIPNLTVANDTGQKFGLASLLPDGTLMTFWSSQCEECKIGLEDQKAFAANHPQLKMLLVNVQDMRSSAKAELAQLGLTSYYDDGTAFNKLSGTMPSSYYISGGKIIYFFPGRISTDLLSQLYK